MSAAHRSPRAANTRMGSAGGGGRGGLVVVGGGAVSAVGVGGEALVDEAGDALGELGAPFARPRPRRFGRPRGPLSMRSLPSATRASMTACGSTPFCVASSASVVPSRRASRRSSSSMPRTSAAASRPMRPKPNPPGPCRPPPPNGRSGLAASSASATASACAWVSVPSVTRPSRVSVTQLPRVVSSVSVRRRRGGRVVVVLLGEGGDRPGQEGTRPEDGGAGRQAPFALARRWCWLFVGHGNDREGST